MNRVSILNPDNSVVQLVSKIDAILKNHDVNDVKDALLTLITWWIADAKPELNCSVNEFIDILASALKESVATQLSVMEIETATKQ